MKRIQSWEPDTHNARFVCEWDDAEPDAPMVCVEATVDGVKSEDPQGDYDRILAENQAINRARE